MVHVAAERGCVDILRAAFEHGADVDARDAKQCTPLHYVTRRNTVDVVNALVRNGANLEARTDDGETPLHEAASSLNSEFAMALLKHGADMNARDRTFVLCSSLRRKGRKSVGDGGSPPAVRGG